ncbi:MAG: head-tail connector protein [Oscillospiraceae bacterium]|nr:head-tail connector protein [Oscillospiraceae bacterium]
MRKPETAVLLLSKVKANLILEHDADDVLLLGFIRAALSYAESYQHRAAGYYNKNALPPTTEQAVIMLSSHFYESRDGSTAGFFGDNVQAGRQVWDTVNMLLRLERNWGAAI